MMGESWSVFVRSVAKMVDDGVRGPMESTVLSCSESVFSTSASDIGPSAVESEIIIYQSNRLIDIFRFPKKIQFWSIVPISFDAIHQ